MVLIPPDFETATSKSGDLSSEDSTPKRAISKAARKALLSNEMESPLK
jgi:hypothetical protein